MLQDTRKLDHASELMEVPTFLSGHVNKSTYGSNKAVIRQEWLSSHVEFGVIT